jgi:hypothetical protein
MATPTPLFCYSLLDRKSNEIRLLKLGPDLDPEDHRIHCDLSSTTLEKNFRTYEALSYAWGPPDELGLKIWLNGVLAPVRKNLHDALHELRKGRLESRVLWIDALCINQENIAERGHQVDMMGGIYKNAAGVLVWLGVSKRPFAAMQSLLSQMVPGSSTRPSRLDQQVDRVSWLSDVCKKSFAAMQSLLSQMVPEPSTRRSRLDQQVGRASWLSGPRFHVAWQELRELCDAPYWTRVWIVQEIGLASKATLLIGGVKFDWTDFSILRDFLDGILPYLPDNKGIIQTLRAIRSSLLVKLARRNSSQEMAQSTNEGVRQDPKWLLEELLAVTVHLQCQDPRDKIYGMLGLADDVKPGDISADYTVSTEDLYWQVMKWKLGSSRMGTSGRQEALCFETFSYQLKLSLPVTSSPVPSFSNNEVRERYNYEHSQPPREGTAELRFRETGVNRSLLTELGKETQSQLLLHSEAIPGWPRKRDLAITLKGVWQVEKRTYYQDAGAAVLLEGSDWTAITKLYCEDSEWSRWLSNRQAFSSSRSGFIVFFPHGCGARKLGQVLNCVEDGDFICDFDSDSWAIIRAIPRQHTWIGRQYI